MEENRLEILKMIRDGRITPEEGLELLKAIEPANEVAKSEDDRVELQKLDDTEVYSYRGEEGIDEPGKKEKAKKKPRFLIIQVTQGGRKKVNVKIPLKLAKLASRFIPKSAQAHMKAEGVEFDLNELLSGIEEIGAGEDLVNVVDDEKGEVVRIFCT
jgi:DUF4097 and DUF4098 domain-containing protein YvlB